jgi:hypothetical protein
MKAPPTRTKVLRVAAVVDELVCDEVHQSRPSPITVGTDYRSDVVLFGAAAPVRHRLFDYAAGSYFLDVPPHAKGKISLGKKAVTLSKLRAQFGKGDALRVQLNANARGKLVIGDTIILFQFADPKPLPPRLPFPIEFRPRLRDVVSPREGAALAGSALVLGTFFVRSSYLEFDGTIRPEDIDERFASVMGIHKPEKKEVPEETKKDLLEEEEEEKVEEKKPEKKIEKIVLKDKPEKFSEKAMKEARGVGIARVLGTYGGDGPGTVLDVIGETENNLGELFAMGMTTTVMAGSHDIGAFVPGGSGITERGAAVQTQGLVTGSGPALDNKEDKLERKVKGVTKATKTDIFGDVDKKALSAAIRHRTSALQHCYNQALRSQPDLAGKHTYTIAVSVMGNVTSLSIDDDSLGSPAVSACAKAKIQGWRFPMEGATESAEVTFTVVYSGGS